MFYELEPEVAGGFGDEAELDNSVHPPKVNNLHIVLDGWLGDSLLECFPVYLVTQELKSEIESESLTGCNFESAKITTSDQFRELYPDRDIPEFIWLKVKGVAGRDDFGISSENSLVISKKVMNLSELKIENCDSEPYSI